MLKGSVSLRLAIGHTTVAVISEWFSIGRSDLRRCLLGAITGGTPHWQRRHLAWLQAAAKSSVVYGQLWSTCCH
jgi:hypothetical protein